MLLIFFLNLNCEIGKNDNNYIVPIAYLCSSNFLHCQDGTQLFFVLILLGKPMWMEIALCKQINSNANLITTSKFMIQTFLYWSALQFKILIKFLMLNELVPWFNDTLNGTFDL